jgi:hypothetical protein
MVTGSAMGLPRSAHLPHVPEGGLDSSDKRLDGSDLTQQKKFPGKFQELL